MDEDSRCSVVAELNKKHGINSNMIDHEVVLMMLQQKIDFDFKKFL